MDYSSQDSNPIDFSKSSKDLVHNKVPNALPHAIDEELERRVMPIVRQCSHNIIKNSPNQVQFQNQDENNNGDSNHRTDAVASMNLTAPISSPFPSSAYPQKPIGPPINTNPSTFSPNKQFRAKYENSQAICKINDAYLSAIERNMSKIPEIDCPKDKVMDAPEFHDVKSSDDPAILRVPPHYAQLAAALGLNSQTIMESVVATPTDFENLIEMQRKLSSDNNAKLDVPSVCTDVTNQKQTAWDCYQNSPKMQNDTAHDHLSENKLNRQNYVDSNSSNNSCSNQMMDIDETVPPPTNEKFIGHKQKLFEHFGKKAFLSYAYESNLKENQNILNQNCDLNNANQGDENMWRPW